MTRGFLFADLRDYTTYVDAHGDRAGAALLERYRALVRAAVTAAGGAEIRTEGDSFYVAFGSVSAAIRAGLAIVDAAATTAAEPDAIRVGVGVHAGETTETAEGFVGSAVNIAARLCAQAKGGELVVSETVRSITRTQIEVEFQPLGLRRLKGVAEPIACYRVVPGGIVTVRARSQSAAGRHPQLTAAALAVAAVDLALGHGIGVRRAHRLGEPRALSQRGRAAILAALPPALAQSCVRGGTPDNARLAGFAGHVINYAVVPPVTLSVTPTGSLGGVTCHPATGAIRLYVLEPISSTYYNQLFPQNALADEYLGYLAGFQHLPFGSCATDTRANESWTSPSGQGTLACMNPYDGRPWIYFTFDKGRYLAFATRDDSNYGDLYAWWEQLKTFLP